MRILFQHTNCRLPRGTEWVNSFCRALAEEGHEVVLATMAPESGANYEALAVHRLGFGLRLSWAQWPLVGWQLARLCLRYRIDVVHYQLNLMNALSMAVFRLLCATPAVAHCHVPPWYFYCAWLDRWPISTAFDRLIACSEKARQELLERCPALTEKILVVHNAAELTTRPYVAAVMRVTFVKGVDVLLLAFSELVARGHDVELLVCGSDFTQRRVGGSGYRALARTLGIAKRVKFLGRLPRPALDEVVRNSVLFALPSRWEAHSLALLEAMALGKAVVATRVGGAEETIRDGVDGLLVAPNDPGELARAMGRLLSDPELRRRLGNAAAERARDFSWPAHARACLGVYRELLPPEVGHACAQSAASPRRTAGPAR